MMMIERLSFLLFFTYNICTFSYALYYFPRLLSSTSSNSLQLISYVNRVSPLWSSIQQSPSISTQDEPSVIDVFDKAELTKLFGRIADTKMLLDVPG